MILNGVSDDIRKVFEPVSRLECIREYFLIGGTALSLQLNHRLSQDLDFCKWTLPEKSEINWPSVLDELKTVFKSVEADILDFNQVNFLADKIKLSFYSNRMYRSPVKKFSVYLNNIKIPDIQTLGALKLELMLRRSKFRDYYDLFAILKEGISLKDMVDEALTYSNHILKTRDILNFISSGTNFKKDKEFDLLQPRFMVSEDEIEKCIRDVILQEYKSRSL
jgi:predicted nucleotidyltransferase component of viral defense system